MNKTNKEDDEDFVCSICQNVFNNPVSIKCQHSFCKLCITGLLEFKIEE